jgi:hypothetical protein
MEPFTDSVKSLDLTTHEKSVFSVQPVVPIAVLKSPFPLFPPVKSILGFSINDTNEPATTYIFPN